VVVIALLWRNLGPLLTVRDCSETSETSADLVQETMIGLQRLRLTRGDAEPANVLAIVSIN
jgi:hypothetical protein